MALEAPEVFIKNRKEWRGWLINNHTKESKIWLVYNKKSSGLEYITWEEIVQEALCFGWIDSTHRKVDDIRTKIYMCKRKPKSVWSAINKAYIKNLSKEGLMYPAGQRSVDIAKENGMWSYLDDIDNEVIPDDFGAALEANPAAKKHYFSLTPSARKQILYQIKQAKREETRKQRINNIIEATSNNKRLY